LSTVSKRLVNLTFHGIGRPERTLDPGEDLVWVSEERFTSVLDAVADRHDVHITFDDGNASDVEIALPALQQRRLTATFFVVAGRLDRPGFLGAGDITTLESAGMRIGSHGMHHRPWRELGADALREEIVDARRSLQAVAQAPVATAACPFGAYGRRSLRALRAAGFERVYTSDRGPAGSEAWLQARTSITEDGELEPVLAGDSSVPRRIKQVLKRWR
jgi:peptidoglycan/xylan/chitin deacetylase (PgdA/CDA1 family)